jgi:ABC transport system ATP-binding/permease protein
MWKSIWGYFPPGFPHERTSGVAPPLLTLKDISLGFGGNPLFDGTEIAIGRGDRICLVGRNGSGKSTLLKIAAGLVEPDLGERVLQSGRSVAYLEQEPDLSGFATVADYVATGLDSADDGHRVAAVLDDLKLDGGLATDGLSGGENRRAALARTLVGEPDILLLDEPTNHLDLTAIRWLEETLEAHRSGFVLVSHDRALLENVTRTTFWLDRGVVRRLNAGYGEFEAWADELARREAEERHKLDRLIAQETTWSHQGITARRKRNQGRLRRLWEMRAERARRIDPTGRVKLAAESGTTSGKLVVEAKDISFAYPERSILKGFSSRVMRGDRVGIVGPNGAGKSTLLGLLTGHLAPDSGSVRRGTGLTTVYLDQRRTLLDPHTTVWDMLCDQGGDQVDVRGHSRHVVAYLRDFLFAESQARSPVGSLSGGERNRLLLAKTLARPSNFLILDEPTNDLDTDTLDLMQEMLADYDGTVLLVSHDRDFLDRVVTSTIVMAGDASAVEYPGGYSDYLRQCPAPVAKKAPRPAATVREKPKSRPTKLTYKQQRLLEQLPGKIAGLEQDISALETKLNDPGLYDRDPKAFDAAAARLAQARQDLATAEDQWLEIEMLREELARR